MIIYLLQCEAKILKFFSFQITLKVELLTLITSLTYMFAPALCADYISSQAEKVLLILHENMLQEKGIVGTF